MNNKNTKNKIDNNLNIQENSKGAALIWAIFAVMVVAIFLGIFHTLIMSYVDRSVLSRDNRQAYLTARSVCNTIAEAIIKETNQEFTTTIANMQEKDRLEIKDIQFQLDSKLEDGTLNPTIVMPEATGVIIKESKDTLKVIGNAEVGKGKKSVGAILKTTPKGSDTLYIRGGMTVDWPVLHTGENTNLVIEGDFTGIGKRGLDTADQQYRDFKLHIEDGNLMVKGNVKIMRMGIHYDSEGIVGKINGNLIAEGDVLLQNIYIGNEESDRGGIYTPGNVVLETRRNLEQESSRLNLQLDMHIYGDIVCNELDINIDTDTQASSGQQLVIYGDIQATEGVYINGKPLVFSKHRPRGEVYWVEDFREDKGRKLVIKGNEKNDVDMESIKVPVITEEPKWVQNIPEDLEVIHTGPQGDIQNEQIIKGGGYYRIDSPSGDLKLFADKLTGIGYREPVTFIIPKDTSVRITDYIAGVTEQGVVSTHDIYTNNKTDREAYKSYKPRVRFIIEEKATLTMKGDSYVHIYGKQDGHLVMGTNALIGSVSVDNLNTAGKYNGGANISYHAMDNEEGTGGTTSYELDKYFNP